MLVNTYLPNPFTAKIEDQPIQQEAVQTTQPDNQLTSDTNLYEGIQITREGLIEALEVDLGTDGISDKLDMVEKIIQCESGWQINVYSKGKVSYGISQYTVPTFKQFCSGDYKNPYDQIKCMSKMISAGLKDRWDCTKILGY